jgi:hypothetical protein
MDITPETKIGPLLDAYPQLEEVLLAQAPMFGKLKNPVLRRTVARVATLDSAARMAGLSPRELVTTLRRAAGLESPLVSCPEQRPAEDEQSQPPWVASAPVVTTIDAERLLESGQTPLPEILRAATALAPGTQLEILTSFRPEPLLDALHNKGFQTYTQQPEPDRVRTRVYRPDTPLS